MVYGIIFGVLAAGLIFGAMVLLKKKLVSATATQSEKLKEEIAVTTGKLKELAAFAPAYASKLQLTAIEDGIGGEITALSDEKNRLKQVEEKLESAQKLVEEKEGTQQETKASKDEDEQKLRELLAAYNDISSESIALERKLASSLKNLETMMGEVQMTDQQKTFLNELVTALTDASSQLRELLTEYQSINERLNNLEAQHNDLEEEYTKLVEQQLGE
jgi:DNA repair exonuclease SbcCD ATPase subunit